MPVYEDGATGGSVVVSINSVTYVADNISITAGGTHVPQYDETGLPDSGIVYPDFATGTATLQSATSSTAMPTVGMTFDEDLGRGAAERWVLTEVGKAYENRGITKFNISFVEVINAGS